MTDIHRWNFEDGGDGIILVCKNLHDKGEKCEYERLTVTDAEAMISRISVLEVKRIHLPPVPCYGCSKPVYRYQPEYCCDGSECGCMGLPVEPPLCPECWEVATRPDSRAYGH
jgi:hypothetical protein